MKMRQGPPPGPKAPHWALGGRHDREPGSCEGGISDWKWNERGQAAGFFLEDGTEVRFPPHEAPAVLKTVGGPRVGVEVSVEGHWHSPPHESRHFDAESIATVGKLEERKTEVVTQAEGKPPLAHDSDPSGRLMESVLDRMESLEQAVSDLGRKMSDEAEDQP